ncbi:MAG TPA: hypothetical protein PLD88_03900 [Candidatus Berkiella sp.]|nr:hypothetical protein [Candidatus Berkiella sp.]
MRRESQQKRNGFTLVEGVMVILLIMIIGTSSISIFKGHELFIERFFTDEISQMILYARKVAMSSQCDVEISYTQRVITLLQKQHCQEGNFTQQLSGNNLLDNTKQFTVNVPKGIDFMGQFPIVINRYGVLQDKNNMKLAKISWRINHKIINVDPISGFTYESK